MSDRSVAAGSMVVPMPLPHDVLKQAAAGEPAAVDALIVEWGPTIVRWCGRLGGPRIDAASLSFHDLGAAPLVREPPDPRSLEQAERAYIKSVLDQHGQNRSAAARAMGIARTSLQYKLQRLGIS